VSDEELDPLDPMLGEAIARERARVTPADAKKRVLARLETSIGGAPPDGGDGGGDGGGAGGMAGAAGTASRLLPIVAAFIVGTGVGGAVVFGVLPPRVVFVDRPVSTAIREQAPSEATPAAPSVPPEAPPPDTSPALPHVPPAGVPDARGVPTLTREREILDVARTAIGRGDGAHALEAASRHQREFPRGQMAEEREALAIQALVRLERRSEAEARAARFRRSYPSSVFLPVIDVALGMGGSDR
jgi:hypothetical protein